MSVPLTRGAAVGSLAARMNIARLIKRWVDQFFSPDAVLREKYGAFKALLENDRRCHELIATLEEVHYSGRMVETFRLAALYDELAAAVSELIAQLRIMAPAKYPRLESCFQAIDADARACLAPPATGPEDPYVIALTDERAVWADTVGGKARNIAIMGKRPGLPVPAGFAVTTSACGAFIEANNLQGRIGNRLAVMDVDDPLSVERCSMTLRALIRNAPVPPPLSEAIRRGYRELFRDHGTKPRVALRSSAVCEDSAFSFAGQYRSVLNVQETGLLEAYKEVLASKYSPHALCYRVRHGLAEWDTPMAVLVMEQINAAVSGVMLTSMPEAADSGLLAIHAIWGMGGLLVGGAISPDIYTIRKGSPLEVIDSKAACKKIRLVITEYGGQRQETMDAQQASAFCITEPEVLTLARWGAAIEEYYAAPQEVEWCLDRNGRLYILQCRPLVVEQKAGSGMPPQAKAIDLPLLLGGGERAAGGVACGRVYKASAVGQYRLSEMPEGAVLVTEQIPPLLVQALGRLRAVVAERGSVAGHFASVAREFGVPTIVGMANAVSSLQSGQEVTVDADGSKVYAGLLAEPPGRGAAARAHPETPLQQRLKRLIGHVSPLGLVDPEHPDFAVGKICSLHDIIRFVHEKSMNEMFVAAYRQGARARGSRILLTELPIRIYLVDIGGGLALHGQEQADVGVEQVTSRPMQAIWRGLSHPEVHWHSSGHFDWQSFSEAVMGGGVVDKDSRAYASYAVVGRDYVNFNIRFGYHYTVVDAHAGSEPENNYITLRFVGGGANLAGRTLRLQFIGEVLRCMAFRVTTKGDLLEACRGRDQDTALLADLDRIGRLLGATKLLDMVIRDDEMARQFAREFMDGRYDFFTAAATNQ